MTFIEYTTFILETDNHTFLLDANKQTYKEITQKFELYLIHLDILPDQFEEQCVKGFNKLIIKENIRDTESGEYLENMRTIYNPKVILNGYWPSKDISNKKLLNGEDFLVCIKKEYQ